MKISHILPDTANVAVKSDGLHMTDRLFDVGLGIGVGVVPVLDPPLATVAVAMLLEAAAEDSATKACEKLAVPYTLWQ